MNVVGVWDSSLDAQLRGGITVYTKAAELRSWCDSTDFRVCLWVEMLRAEGGLLWRRVYIESQK